MNINFNTIMVIMMISPKKFFPLNIQAHYFKSTTAATALAEKNSTKENIEFARDLITCKQTHVNYKPNQMVRYDGVKLQRREKYDKLALIASKIDSRSDDLHRAVSEKQWGNQVIILSERPDDNYLQAAKNPIIWPSSKVETEYGVFIPKTELLGKTFSRFTSMDATIKKIGYHFDAKELKNSLDGLKKQLEPRANDKRYVAKGDNKDDYRYTNILSNVNTRVYAGLNANRVAVGGEDIAIASQSPLKHQVSNHLRMLVAECSPVAAVLTSKSEIANSVSLKTEHTNYFGKEGMSYFDDGMATECEFKGQRELADGVLCDTYHMHILENGEYVHSMVVLHVGEWPDHGTISANATMKLAQDLNWYTNYQSEGIQSGLPVVNCNAGVGRTGLVISSMAMASDKIDPSVSLKQIVSDVRTSRNGEMIQGDKQLGIAIEIAAARSRPLI